jgi:hypothetical protein
MSEPSAGPCVAAIVQIDRSPDEVYRLITDLPTLANLDPAQYELRTLSEA